MAVPDAAPRGVVIFAAGSRGDVQPFVALALGFARAGFRALVLTNANHVEFVKGFGIDAEEMWGDTEKMIRTTPGLLDCMKNGNFLTFMKILGELSKQMFPASFAKSLAAAARFKPDVILTGGLARTGAGVIGAVQGVPVLFCDLAGFVPTGCAPSFLGEPAWLPAFVHRLGNRLVMWGYLKSEREGKHPAIAEACPEVWPFVPKNLEQLSVAEEFGQGPVLIGTSPLLLPRAKDWAWEPVVTGHWVIGPEEQERRMGRGEAHFAGGGAAALEAFLAAGPPPVYIGWGSMVCVSSEFMACTAVRALMLASLRGVVLGGWAELGPEHLQGQPELLDYAAKHVHFAKSAAHEWLFPRCAATVHHGGAGTTAAALRSGRPTIVTPCGFDQPIHAGRVAASGAGLALPTLAKATPEQLAAALRHAVGDAAMAARAAELGEKLRAEDGVSNAVRAVEEFLATEVATGAWAAKMQRRRDIVRQLESPGFLTRLGFLCSSICTNSIKSQVKW